MPSKKKAEEEKRKMSASNRQSRLRGGKSTRNFDQQRARQGKKSSSAEKNPQRGGNLHRHPSPPSPYGIGKHQKRHIEEDGIPPTNAVFEYHL